MVKAALIVARPGVTFRRALAQLMATPPGKVPHRTTVGGLIVGWGNRSFAADIEYLLEVSRQAAAAQGPILECGSGLTTILLGAIAGRRGIPVWSLEHAAKWHARVGGVVEQNAIPGVNVCLAPLRDYGEFAWYDPPLEQLPARFSLVVCDGPPGRTKGGRYGLLPVLGARIAVDAAILLDDVDRHGEASVVDRWTEQFGGTVQFRQGRAKDFAVLTGVGSFSSHK